MYMKYASLVRVFPLVVSVQMMLLAHPTDSIRGGIAIAVCVF